MFSRKIVASTTAVLAVLCAWSSSISPASAADVLSEGIKEYGTGRYDIAKLYLRMASFYAPKNWVPKYYLGCTFIKLDDYDSAKTQFKNILQLNPAPQIKTYCDKAIVLLDNPQPASADGGTGTAAANTTNSAARPPAVDQAAAGQGQKIAHATADNSKGATATAPAAASDDDDDDSPPPPKKTPLVQYFPPGKGQSPMHIYGR